MKEASFLTQVAHNLYEKYGDEVSSLTILFPSRRARLFFNTALSKIADKPLWQPEYTTIEAVMENISGLVLGDHIKIITELYDIYKDYHEESFDSFYFWGEMLLADFDAIDKYMIEADRLFSNISDLKDIEDNFEYLNEEQAEIVARFWKSFGHQADFSNEKQKFINIWNTLAPIYNLFKKRLSSLGIAYTGMLYRDAAEKIRERKFEVEDKRYVIAGFNALSESEKVLFKHLQTIYNTEFFWDYDHYYLDDNNQEAGLFLRENVKLFPQKISSRISDDCFKSPKNISVISSPSDILQCKYVGNILNELGESSGRKPDTETAIVLTDENLLIPLLHSIPSDIDKINVTMGYPLKLTTSYAFVERLLLLQSRCRASNGDIRFYHSDVEGILRHPFLVESTGEESLKILEDAIKQQQIYLSLGNRTENEIILKIFDNKQKDASQLSDYLTEVLSVVVDRMLKSENVSTEAIQNAEYLSTISNGIIKLKNSLKGCNIEISNKVYTSLLRKILQNIRIPFEGEPLQGVQVMGILETRNLDFKNVILLSMTDDNFPGNRESSSSFIPYNLRFAYGLPTPAHHEGVYAYYFYRLLQRAENVYMVYSSRSDEKSTGEQSRYIYQLEYESPHDINRKTIGLDVNVNASEAILIEKKGSVLYALQEYLLQSRESSKKSLSPTSLFNYITCPLKFYFHSIAGLSEDKEISEEIDAPLFGTILHATMELLYAPLLAKPEPYKQIAELIDSERVVESVEEAILKEYFHGSEVKESDYSGNLMLVKDIVIKYVNKCILPYDASKDDYMIYKLEEKISSPFEFELNGELNSVMLSGLADRIDKMNSGGYRIVDYKTGKDHLVFDGIDSLFSKKASDLNSAAFQTFLYSLIMNRTVGTSEIQPSLYYVRQMNQESYSPLLDDKSMGHNVFSYNDYKLQYEELLAKVLRELFDLSMPFVQCEDVKSCEWCEFNIICKRA